ncbi:MAG: DUF4279 domain-containing protein [Desulfobulbaceae bacterium]|nr:DUF4279 domain-containing protein [Desulfobulbaceae bacterium]
MDTYTVEFRIEGTELVPSEVTRVLGLEPCQTRDMAANKDSKRHCTPLWSYDGMSSETDFVEQEWKSLEEGLLFLLDKLSPKRELIQKEFSDYDKYWWCGHFQDSFDGGPTFSPKLLKKLADFGIELIISNYMHSEEDAK